MKRLLLTSCVALGALSVLGADAHARDDGFYIGVGAGYNIPHDQDLDISNSNNPENQTIEQLGGPGALGAFGYKYEEGWRAEIEAGFRTSEVDGISDGAGSGDVDAWTLIVNGLYDFEADGFTPYLGAGAGVAFLNYSRVTPVNDVNGTTSLNRLADPNLALQAIAGVSFEIFDDVELTTQYNFLAVPEVEVDTGTGLRSRSEFYDHLFTVGLRYTFPMGGSRMTEEPEPVTGQSVLELAPEPEPEPEPEPVQEAVAPPPVPPPAPPAPEPEITRNFIVYFDWDEAVLTPATQAILRQAAQFAEDGNVARIILTGHADRSGTEQYNIGLSQERSDMVRAMLVELGQPAQGIVTFARGETEPLVPTADGIREPQNRRVEIVLE